MRPVMYSYMGMDPQGPPVDRALAYQRAFGVGRNTALRMETCALQTRQEFVTVRSDTRGTGFMEASYVVVPAHHTITMEI